MPHPCGVGVDSRKPPWTSPVDGPGAWQTTNDEGWARSSRTCHPAAAVIVLEPPVATRSACQRAPAAGFPVAIVNPRQVRDFARRSAVEKTDAIERRPRRLPSRIQPALGRSPMISTPICSAVTRRRQLVEMLG